jgi:hypothetical protein
MEECLVMIATARRAAAAWGAKQELMREQAIGEALDEHVA